MRKSYGPNSARAVSTRAPWQVSIIFLRDRPNHFGQVLKRWRTLLLDFVEKAKDHLRAPDVLTGAIEERILHHLRCQSAN
jgi:hypothetical protein